MDKAYINIDGEQKVVADIIEYKDKKEHECEICKAKFDHEPLPLVLCGTNDVYTLDVCSKCFEIYTYDYYSPEYVDELIKR